MEEVSFGIAMRHLELGYTVQSLLSDRQIKIINKGYYWRIKIDDGKYTEWQLCESDDWLFRVGEVQNNWCIVEKTK